MNWTQSGLMDRQTSTRVGLYHIHWPLSNTFMIAPPNSHHTCESTAKASLIHTQASPGHSQSRTTELPNVTWPASAYSVCWGVYAIHHSACIWKLQFHFNICFRNATFPSMWYDTTSLLALGCDRGKPLGTHWATHTPTLLKPLPLGHGYNIHG